MSYVWIFDLYMAIVEMYFWFKEKPKPLPEIVCSVPSVPLKK